MKKVLLVLIMVLSFTMLVQAEEDVKILLNGKPLATDVAPIIVNDRVMVPMRAIGEGLGCSVAWDAMTERVSIENKEALAMLEVGKDYIDLISHTTAHDKRLKIDSPAILHKNRTLVPIRAISESFFSLVDWDEETRTVSITQIADRYDEMSWYSEEGLAWVEKDGKRGFIDRMGEEVIPLIYDEAWEFSEGLAVVWNDGLAGYIDTTGEMVIPQMYSLAGKLFKEGKLGVGNNGEMGVIDKKNNIVIPFIYQETTTFSEGLMAVKRNGKWGYIDAAGKTVVPHEFDLALEFSEGLAVVTFGTQGDIKYGFVGTDGELKIPAKYNVATSFRDGEAYVCLDGDWFYIDKTGNKI